MRPTRLFAILAVLCGSFARADVLVTLEARDSLGQLVTAPVTAGTTLVVDLLLSVDDADDPLDDVRAIQFDFAATGDGIELGTFGWRLDAASYEIQSSALPTPSVATLFLAPDDALLGLTRTPVRVATIDVTVNTTGALNAIGPTASDRTSDASLTAGFDSLLVFSLFANNLRGSVLNLESSGADVPDPGGVQDADGDGVPDAADAFPDDPNETIDTDGDNIGDNADLDDDGDGVPDMDDAFPLDASESVDSDGDNVGDNADVFPNDPDESLDTDGDGMGNNADADDDNDGVDDADDAFPLDPTETRDSDGDGVGDNAEMDSNTGPRATGSLCGALSPAAFLVMLLCLGVAGRGRRRRSV